MKRKLLRFIIILGILLPGLACSAVTKEDFMVKTTRNLINLCTVSPQDKYYVEAIHFCHGYWVGAYHYFLAESSNDPNKSWVCFTEPEPSRNEAIALFIAWSKTHPQFMTEIPVETEFRFLAEKWPCKK
jgi:Rap1a immunity proteins